MQGWKLAERKAAAAVGATVGYQQATDLRLALGVLEATLLPHRQLATAATGSPLPGLQGPAEDTASLEFLWQLAQAATSLSWLQQRGVRNIRL